MTFRSFLLPILFLLSFQHNIYAQRIKVNNGGKPSGAELMKRHWVDSVYNSLDDTERLGQLFMIAAYSGGRDYNYDKVKTLIAERRVGGLIFMQGTPEAQAVQHNEFQQMAQVPLLIGMDAEWGLGMRLTGVKDMPRNMMIGATKDSIMAYRVGAAIAAQMKRLGVHINFAPVVDVNNNPDNPIINARSFGENKQWVTAMGLAYMHGLQDNGVMACAKHFPGHGDTKTDSHEELPVIDKTIQQLDTLELYPFRKLINAGVGSVMVAHLQVPVFESAPQTPTTLSYSTITGQLKQKMGFKGLVFTDAMNMQGITKYYPAGEADLKAFLAGNDMLLFSQNVPVSIARMKTALDSGIIQRIDLEQRVKKVLAAKYDMGLTRYRTIDPVFATEDLNKNIPLIRSKVAEAGITLVRDRNEVIDRLLQKDLRIGYIGVNASDSTLLASQLKHALPNMQTYWLAKGDKPTAKKVEDAMDNNTLNVVVVHNMTFYPGRGNYGLDNTQVEFLEDVANKKNTMVVLMGNAYWSRNICDAGSILVAYEDDSVTETVVSKILLKKMDAKGTLPVTPCPGMVTEKRMVTTAVTKPVAAAGAYDLQPTDFAEDAGVVNAEALDKLNLFLQRSIADGAFPGCRVVAARNGKVFYNKAFGYYDYSRKKAVDQNTIYDVASCTKVLATTLAVMRLYEEGKLDLDKTLGDYLGWTRGTDKAGLKIRNLLLHQAGLKSWIPFYKQTLDEQGKLRSDVYSNTNRDKYNVQVANDLYMNMSYVDTVWAQILNSPLENKGKYVYSDLDFYFLAAVVQQLSKQPLDAYVKEQFYKPLGLTHISYKPLNVFKTEDIAPTEKDTTFRKQLLKGYVHDPGAAMFGGVAGHAGIFASADDVAVIMQMLMNKGVYKNRRYFKKETIDRFTAYSSRISRRALGFDKPSADKEDGGPAGNRVTGTAFGHQGFTGTCVWADPQTGVLFVFLSNRVNPLAENNRINRLSVRTVAQDYIYEALGLPIDHKRQDVWQSQAAE